VSEKLQLESKLTLDQAIQTARQAESEMVKTRPVHGILLLSISSAIYSKPQSDPSCDMSGIVDQLRDTWHLSHAFYCIECTETGADITFISIITYNAMQPRPQLMPVNSLLVSPGSKLNCR
jgi:hypothetical protein